MTLFLRIFLRNFFIPLFLHFFWRFHFFFLSLHLETAQMGDGYDYLALGHIHHGQFVHSGKHNVRYCGTPLPVSFDETFTHSVTMVEIGRHGEKPIVTEIEIENPHSLVTLPTDGFTTWEEAKELLVKFPDNIPAYIRLNVEVDDFLPLEAQAEEDNRCERLYKDWCQGL